MDKGAYFQRILFGISSKLEEIFTNYNRLYIACSGGRDSIFLSVLIIKACLDRSLDLSRVKLAHVNYHLRGVESDFDQRFTEEFAKANSIDCEVLSVSTDRTEGIENWARQTRYDFFDLLHKKHNAMIAVAHQLNDVAENILFRLTRGSSVSKLVGMNEFSKDRSYIWRPLLNVSRNDIDSFIKMQGLSFREDQSNKDLSYSRNKIRHSILPELESMYPNACQRIVNSILDASEVLEYTKELLSKQMSRFKNDKVPVSFLKTLPDGVAFLLFDLMVQRLDGRYQFKRSNFSDFISKIKSGKQNSRTWSHSLSCGINLCYDRVFVFVSKNKP